MPPSIARRLNGNTCGFLVAALVAGIALTPQPAIADAESDRASPRSQAPEESASSSRGDPCDPLLPEVVFEFAGAINNTVSAVHRATVVQCTNRGATSTEIQVVLYQYNATSAYCGNVTVDPQDTATFESSSVEFYTADVVMGAGFVEQGLGQIRANITELICTVQVVDPDNTPPAWGFDIPLYRVSQ